MFELPEFVSKLHPRHPIDNLSRSERRRLHHMIVRTVVEVVRLEGRNDEHDLFDRPGGYVRVMDKNAVGHPCPDCGRKIEKIQYLGGACYFCPGCQL